MTQTVCERCGAALTSTGDEGTMGLCPACLLKAGMEQTSPPASASAAPALTPNELQEHFPNLEILQVLGQGGMGIVYKARQPHLDRFVALKVLRMASDDPSFAERFTREARALARLSHPNIVAIYDFGHAGELYYLVMEHVDGVNLRQLEHTARLTPKQALEIVPQICEALQYAHDEGIVHRDVKPENILVDKRGRVKIADFGLAKLIGAVRPDYTLTQPEHLMGTMHYMAPEQMEKPTTVDHRADIYSLGVVLYEMLTGELPLGRFAPPSKKTDVDGRVDHVVFRALEKEPDDRYQHASEVKLDLQTAITPPPLPSPESPQRIDDPIRAIPLAYSTEAGPRLSRAAVWGAIWAPWFWISIALFLVPVAHVSTAGPGPAAPPASVRWVGMLAMPFLLLGLTAPFGTTLLGFAAISQIRRSGGQLYGMGLAIADALFYPLLLLDALIVAVMIFAIRLSPMATPAIGTIILALSVVLCIVVDWLIVRQVARSARRLA